MNPAAWLRNNRSVYLDNATSRRDYRVQLRGNRSVILFGVYLFVLIGVGMFVYSNTATMGNIEVVEAQRKLKDFYGVVMALLGGVVTLIAPALSATTVIAERQRRSFDLIFSAPVSPKYYLVGKMMSSYRYTWMLLILSLPVTAACVVLGGASWSDVLIAYLLLSLHGLMLTAIALLMSTVSPRPVTAILWSYLASLGYIVITAAGGAFMAFGRGGSHEAPFFSALNPFMVQMSADTYTTIGGMHVPNWVFTILIAALVSKICLLAAGVIISPRPERQIRSLRLHILAYMGSFVLYVAWAVPSTVSLTGFIPNIGKVYFWTLSPLLLFMPVLSTFGVDAERRFWPDGAFSLRHIIDGRPSGGLPYVLLLMATNAVAAVAGLWFGPHILPDAGFFIWILYTAAFWVFFWSLGRFSSSTFVGLRSARALQFAAFVFLVMLPFPVIAVFTRDSLWDTNNSPLWNLCLLRPLFCERPLSDNLAVVWGSIMLLSGIILAVVAESRTRAKMLLLEKKYEPELQAA